MSRKKRNWLVAGAVFAVLLAAGWARRGLILFWLLDHFAPAPAEWIYPGGTVQRHVLRSGTMMEGDSDEYFRLDCPAPVAAVMAWYQRRLNTEQFTAEGTVTGPQEVLRDEAQLAGYPFGSESLRHPGQPHTEIEARNRAMGILVWGHSAGQRSVIEVRIYHNGR